MHTAETHRQASTWQNVKNKYLNRGLCHPCAGQAAWGHQNGFSSIHEPCLACQPVVDNLPVDKKGPWRGIDASGWGRKAEKGE